MTPPVFDLQRGDGPLLISCPHDGLRIPREIARRMTPVGRSARDADWHVARLYDFAHDLGATRLAANYARYVVDLNRSADGAALYPGQDETGLCPTSSFDHEPLYAPGEEPDENEIRRRIERYWRPYHVQLERELDRIVAQHGFALLWEGHTIRSRVPRFFEGDLPDFNFGTDSGRTCPPEIIEQLAALARDAGYSVAVNGRFRGGYITRAYARPDRRIHSIQLELSQRTYLAEPDTDYDPARAEPLKRILKEIVGAAVTALSDRP